jgi:hypothetical protein
MKETIELYKIRTFNELLNSVFVFIRIEHKLLLKSTLLYSGPFMFLSAILYSYYTNMIYSNLNKGIWDIYFNRYYFMYLGSFLLSVAAIKTVIYSIMKIYAEKNGEPVTVGEVGSSFARNYLRILVATFALAAILIFAFVLLFVPYVWLVVSLMFTLFLMLMEDLSFSQALNQSYRYTGPYWWWVFGFMLVVYLIQGMAAYAFQMPVQIISSVFAINQLTGSATDEVMKIAVIVLTGLASFASLFLSVINEIGITFQYFNVIAKTSNPLLAQKILKMYENEDNSANF